MNDVKVTCDAPMGLYYSIFAGFISDSLDKVAGKITVSGGMSASLQCVFGEKSDDGIISVYVLTKQFTGTQIHAWIGPISVNVQAFIANDGQLVYESGWTRKLGFYAIADDLTHNLFYKNPYVWWYWKYCNMKSGTQLTIVLDAIEIIKYRIRLPFCMVSCL